MAKRIKSRVKLTTDDYIKVNMVSNYGRIFARKWGTPGCETCQRFSDALRDAIVDKYLSMTIEERDTLGTRHLVADPQTFAIIHSGVWLIDEVRMLECETVPACHSCGYKPANQFAQPDDEATP